MAIIPTPDDAPFVEALSELLRTIAGVVALLSYAAQRCPDAPEAYRLAADGQDALVDESTTRDTSSERGWQPNTLLTKAEFCRWVGVSERTLGQWITDGTAPPRMVLDRHVRFRFADCLEWLASRYVA